LKIDLIEGHVALELRTTRPLVRIRNPQDDVIRYLITHPNPIDALLIYHLKYNIALQDLSTPSEGRGPDVLGITSDETSLDSLSGEDKPSGNSSESRRDHLASLATNISLTTPQVLIAGYTIEYSSTANRWSTLSSNT
jgi:hypothetical protein